MASTLMTKDWNLSSCRLALLNSTMLFAAFLGVWLVRIARTTRCGP